jgi:pyruvate dehydrogenase E1 component beta subunit
MTRMNYGSAIRAGFVYLLDHHPEVFVLGQGLWAKWYVGNSMTDLDKLYGPERIMDSPVSELACTGAAVGASLCGYRPVMVHPRLDFMLYGLDAIVNQAAKWSHMVGGQAHPAVTIRGIINRGGEQGAQHSQALHAWFAHIPGLRVVMPATPADARDLLIASKEVTLVGAGYSTLLCQHAATVLERQGVDAEVIDLRVINPLDAALVIESVGKTGRLCVVDGGWRNCGLAGEVIARVAEAGRTWRAAPVRLTLPDAPAPSSRALERDYYTTEAAIVAAVERMLATS